MQLETAHAEALSHSWPLLAEQGYPLALAREDHGGIGATWEDIWPLLRGLGGWQLPSPLADTMIAAALLSLHGVDPRPLIARPLALASVSHGCAGLAIEPRADRPGIAVSGTLDRVAWGSFAEHLICDTPAGLAWLELTDPTRVAVETSEDIAGQPADRLRLNQAPGRLLWVAQGQPSQTVLLLGAAARAVMMVGALESVLEQSVRYCGERVQFGRPIGHNQAIQFQLAQVAGEVATARAAARAAVASLGPFLTLAEPLTDPAATAIAVAKQVAGEAAAVACSVGHQVHGAIGFTREHALQQATRRLWAWRGDFGADSFWAARLGAAVIAAGPDAFWARLTASQMLRSE
jgi:acyl-CoA dehydrogenase